MLRARVITALVLVALLLPVLFFASPRIGSLVALGVMVLACWEWTRLLGISDGVSAVVAALFGAAALIADALFAAPIAQVVMLLASAFWCIVAPWWLRVGVPQSLRSAKWPLIGLGWIVLAATWWAMTAALLRGPVYLLSILLIVWASDVAAYFAGRTFGRHKLAPSISPGKTWEGVAGAVIGVLLLAGGLLWAAGTTLPQTYVGLLGATTSLPVLGVMLIVLVALGIIGDLFESMLKRKAGVKDSSHLLPGHGGVFDRVDALLPVLPAALVIELVLTGRSLLS